MARLLNYFGFVAVALLFALPFGAARTEARVDGVVVIRVSIAWRGTDVVFGGTPQVHFEERLGDAFGSADPIAAAAGPAAFAPYRLPPQPVFIVAALLLLAGAVTELAIRSRARAAAVAVAAFGAIAALLVGQWSVAWHYARVPPVSVGQLLPPAYGLWLALGVLAVIGVGNAGYAVFSRRVPTSPPDPVPSARSASG